MTAQELMSLAERCEAATGADRELDIAIWAVLHPVYAERRIGDHWHEPAPFYTASLDAAMTLAGSEAVSVLLTAIDTCQEDAVSDWVKALPRHICAAALRARASSKAGGRG